MLMTLAVEGRIRRRMENRMQPLEAQRDVDAGADVVWSLITDLDRIPDILSAVTRVERVDDGDGFGAGTRWRETRVVMKREATEEMEVTAVDPDRSYTVESDSRSVLYRSVLSVEPTGDGTSRIRMQFAGKPKSKGAKLAGATIGKLMNRTMRTMLQQDLDDIAAAAERRL